jgi:hypothetical protein
MTRWMHQFTRNLCQTLRQRQRELSLARGPSVVLQAELEEVEQELLHSLNGSETTKPTNFGQEQPAECDLLPRKDPREGAGGL